MFFGSRALATFSPFQWTSPGDTWTGACLCPSLKDLTGNGGESPRENGGYNPNQGASGGANRPLEAWKVMKDQEFRIRKSLQRQGWIVFIWKRNENLSNTKRCYSAQGIGFGIEAASPGEGGKTDAAAEWRMRRRRGKAAGKAAERDKRSQAGMLTSGKGVWWGRKTKRKHKGYVLPLSRESRSCTRRPELLRVIAGSLWPLPISPWIPLLPLAPRDRPSTLGFRDWLLSSLAFLPSFLFVYDLMNLRESKTTTQALGRQHADSALCLQLRSGAPSQDLKTMTGADIKSQTLNGLNPQVPHSLF